MEEKTKIITILLVLILISTPVYAGWFEDIINIISGKRQPLAVFYGEISGAIKTQVYDTKTATIGDYRIELKNEPNCKQISFDGCRQNTCNGAFEHKDKYGCDVWSKTVPEGYYCSSALLGAQLYWVKCTQWGSIIASCMNPSDYYGKPWGTTKCPSGSGYAFEEFNMYLVWQNEHKVSCGGAIIKEETVYTCTADYKIYKDNNLIKSSERYEGGLLVCKSNEIVEYDDLVFKPKTSMKWSGSYCEWIESSFKIKIPYGAFLFNISSVKKSLFRGENATIIVEITNNWRDVNGIFKPHVCQPAFFGETCTDIVKEIKIPKGKTLIDFQIPTEFVVEKLSVLPTIDVLADPTTFPIANLGVVSPINIGRYEGDKISVEVSAILEMKANQLLAMESFGAGKTVSKYSTRYPVVKFAYETNPVLIVKSDGKTTLSKEIYRQLDDGKVMQVPSNEVWTLFYVVENNYQLPTICEGAVDVSTGQCASVASGVIMVCSEGQFDPALGLCVVQGTLKTICEYGRFDVSQGVCIWNPPIQADCSNCAQYKCVYNVNTKKCEWTPETQPTCPSGTTYDSWSNKCVYQPDLQAICPSGSSFNTALDQCEYVPQIAYVCNSPFVYNSKTNKCEYVPPSNVICPEGYTYNAVSNKCERTPPTQEICPSNYKYENGKCVIYPEKTISCPGGYAYDDTLMKCVKYPISEIICVSGSQYNPATNKCEYTPPAQAVCASGYTFNPSTNKCEYMPSSEIICESGGQLVGGRCVVQVSSIPVCEKGVFDANMQMCIYTPEIARSCIQGTYDAQKDACVVKPNMEYLCINGKYNLLTKVCEIHPEEKVICRDGFVFDSEKNKCIGFPEEERIIPLNGKSDWWYRWLFDLWDWITGFF